MKIIREERGKQQQQTILIQIQPGKVLQIATKQASLLEQQQLILNINEHQQTPSDPAGASYTNQWSRNQPTKQNCLSNNS